jgi:hypothetical protein
LADKPIIYPVTEGIASHATCKKYACHFKSFVNHFDSVAKESLLNKDPRVMEAMIIKWIKFFSEQRNQRRHRTIHHEVAAVLHVSDWKDYPSE